MKILALTEGADHVCCRYRIEAFRPAFAGRGWTLAVQPLATSAWRRWRQFREARAYDVVILQRKLLPWWQTASLRRQAKTLVFDFDDAVYGRDSYSPKGHASISRQLRFWGVAFAADAVLAGNEHLRDRAAAIVGADRVHFAPTCVEPQRYSLAAHSAAGGDVQLVWIGQRSTLPSVAAMASHLAAAAAAVPGLALRVVSDVFPSLGGIRVIERPWEAAGEANELAVADVGVSWLPDDPWSRGKCGLKVLQFMAAGLPVVANRVGVHEAMIVDGETGFLADAPEEWSAAIRRLANDPGLRRTMGAAARRRVEERYSVAQWSARLAAVLAETARSRTRRASSAIGRKDGSYSTRPSTAGAR